VPHQKSGKEGLRNAILPFLRDNRVGFRGGVRASWRNHGLETLADGAKAWHYSFTGEPWGKAVDAGDGPSVHEDLAGKASGEVFLERGSNRVLRSDFKWETTTTAWFDQGLAAHPGRLDQAMVATGSLLRSPAVESAPHLHYVAQADVLPVLHGGGALFDACFSEAVAAPVHLDLAVDTLGHVTEARILPPGTGLAQRDACLANAAQKLVFPEQDEPGLHVGYTVARAGGSVQPFPEATVTTVLGAPVARRRPLFVYLPELDAGGWQAFDAALGGPQAPVPAAPAN
jgi:hypothetical protein